MSSLDRSAFRPVLVTQMESPFSERVAATGIETVLLPLPERLRRGSDEILRSGLSDRLRTARLIAGYNRRLFNLAREMAATAVWVRGMEAVLLAGAAARASRLPLVYDIGCERPASPVRRLLSWYALALSARVVTQDSRQPAIVFGAEAARMWRRRIHVLPPGIPAERFTEALERPPARDPRWFTVLCVATLHPRKNQEMLLRAAARLTGQHPTLRVRLVGAVADESYHSRLRELASVPTLQGRVDFLGWREDVASLIRDSDLIVLCSHEEGVPHVLREAMHLETPVVATAIGGVLDLITHEVTGLLVGDGDDRGLAEQIERSIHDAKMRSALATRARLHVERNFSFQAWTASYDALLRDVTGQGRPAD